MKSLKHIFFLLLIIHIGTPSETVGQNLTLKLEAEKTISEGLKDTLQIPKHLSSIEAIERKTDTIFRTFMQMGYIDSELIRLQKENDSSYVAEFILGKKYHSVKIYYNNTDFKSRELESITSDVTDKYFTLEIPTISSAMTTLTDLRSRQGHPFTKIRLSEIEKDENQNLIASLIIEKGNIRTIDSLVIKGYEKFPRPYLKYYAGIRKGNVFNRKKLIEQNERLNSLGFASSKSAPEALFRKDSTIVYFYVEKENNNLFDGILGFATDEQTQKLIFNGYLNLELNNNLDFGEQLLLNYRADGEKQVEFRTKVELPFLFQSRFGVNGELKIFKRDTSFVTTEQQVRLTHQFTPTSKAYLGYRNFISTNLQDEAIAGIPIENFKSRFFVFGANYTKTQNQKMFPIKTFAALDLGLGNRIREGLKDQQWKIEGNLSHIFRINNRNSIYTANTTAALLSELYLVNELFRFGGINSIRGFDENSIDASLFSVINTEYRYNFSESLFIHSIIDLGYFENKTLSLHNKMYSFGLGIGMNTKGGLFRFIVANGRTTEQNFDFSTSKAHISITTRF